MFNINNILNFGYILETLFYCLNFISFTYYGHDIYYGFHNYIKEHNYEEHLKLNSQFIDIGLFILKEMICFVIFLLSSIVIRWSIYQIPLSLKKLEELDKTEPFNEFLIQSLKNHLLLNKNIKLQDMIFYIKQSNNKLNLFNYHQNKGNDYFLKK